MSNYARQLQEKEALAAIYGNDLEEALFPWKIEHPPQFKVHVKIARSNTITIEYEIHFKMTTAYPFGLPIVQIVALKSLPVDVAQELKCKLHEHMQKLVGSEMIYDLIEYSKEFLRTKFGIKEMGTTESNQQSLGTKIKLAASLNETAKSPRLTSESPVAAAKVSVDAFSIEIENLTSSLEAALNVGKNEQMFSSEFQSRVTDLIGAKEQRIRFDRKETRKKNTQNTKFIDVDVPFYVNDALVGTGEAITTLELYKTLQSTENFATFAGKSNQCDQEFYVERYNVTEGASDGVLKRLQPSFSALLSARHSNIVSVYSYKQDSEFFWIVSEFVVGQTLDYIIKRTGGMQPPMAVDYLRCILQALSALHTRNIVHKALFPLNILVEDKDDLSLKLTKCSYFRDLGAVSSFSTDETRIKTKKDDIFNAGVVFLQCVFGSRCVSYSAVIAEDGVKLLDRLLDKLPLKLAVFIGRFFIKPPSMRPSAEDLLLDPIFSANFSLHCGILPLFPDEESRCSQSNSPLSLLFRKKSAISLQQTADSSGTFDSRYKNDFVEIEFLGRGGFGQVVKARNKLDNQVYAIKKILLDPENAEDNRKILREVTALSKLHHQYITRYYQAWLEDCPDGFDAMCARDSKSADVSTDASYSESKSKSAAVMAKPVATHPSNLKNEILFNDRGIFDNLDEETHLFGEYSTRSFANSENDSFLSTSDLSDEQTDDSNTLSRILSSKPEAASQSAIPNKTQRILYIQMEFCSNQTLRDIIDEGILSVDDGWKIVRQIAEALAHIHSQGMIHRDLKPGNIFLDARGDVKIGDFGLALENTGASDDAYSQSQTSVRKTSTVHLPVADDRFSSNTKNVGTPFYTSPEVFSHTHSYNQKIDMYSFGIIIFELVYQFSTGMERAIVLNGLRSPSIAFPLDFDVAKFSNHRTIVANLLSHDPSVRLSAEALLKSPLLPSKVEDQYLEDAIKTLVTPTSTHHHKLLKALFSDAPKIDRRFDMVDDVTFDYNAGFLTSPSANFIESVCQNASILPYFFNQLKMKELIVKVFKRHCMIEFPTPILLPHNPNVPSLGAAGGVKLMDACGTLVFLPPDLLHPVARFAALNNITDIKRFDISHAYKPNPTSGQPRHILECNAQIIWSTPHIAHDARLAKVAHQILKALIAAPTASHIELHVNHFGFLQGLLQDYDGGAGAASSTCAPLLEFLGASDSVSASKFKATLAADFGLAGKLIDTLHAAFVLRGKFTDELLGKIALLFASQKYSADAICEIKAFVEQTTVGCDISDVRIVLDPLLYFANHDGCMYAFKKTNPKRRADVLAYGGRFDTLLDAYRISKQVRYGSAVSISIPKLSSLWTAAPDTLPTKNHNVYVISVKECPVVDRMRVATVLWNAGYSCDFALNTESSIAQTISQIPYKIHAVVFVAKASHKHKDASANGQPQSPPLLSLKIRLIEKKAEADCTLGELLDRLQALLSGTSNNAQCSALSGVYTVVKASNVHYLLQGKRSANVVQNATERAQKAIGALALSGQQQPVDASRVHLVIHDFPRDSCIRRIFNAEMPPESSNAATAGYTRNSLEEMHTKAKTTVKYIVDKHDRESPESYPIIVFYSIREDCFDIFASSNKI